MRGDDLILDAFIIHFYGMIGIVAPENEKVFNCELLRFAPAQL